MDLEKGHNEPANAKEGRAELERLEAISALERGPATPDVSAVAPTAESKN